MNYFQHCILALIFYCCANPILSQKATLYGIVRDAKTGETLPGANVIINETSQGATTNGYGYYSLTTLAGKYVIHCSYVGYEAFQATVELTSSRQMDITLVPVESVLDEVVVTATKLITETAHTGKVNLAPAQIKTITTAAGESDILKTLQLMPGIQSANEGASNLYVRGGSFDQNLILLDEAPVYNPSHALGFFSTFNTDALKSVEVFKGVFPARYGGKLSSVVDISMREGNYRETKVNAGIGLISSKLGIEGPLKKESASYIISGRYSYAGHTLNVLGGDIGRDLLSLPGLNNFSDNNNIWFFDLNAKANFRLNQRNHLYVSTYNGHDYFYCFSLNNANVLQWGNHTSTIRWNHIFSEKTFVNLTVYNSLYRYKYSIAQDIRNFHWTSAIRETGVKADIVNYLNPQFTLRSGLAAQNRYFSPGVIKPASANSITKPFSLDNKNSIETALYSEAEHTLSRYLNFNYGIRYSMFLNLGEGTVFSYNSDYSQVVDSTTFAKNQIINHYQGLEPRMSLLVKLSQKNSLKFAYANTRQYLHLLSNSTVGLPTDTWLPPDKHVKPQSSNQVVGGIYTLLGEIEISIESYFKQMSNILDFRDNADLFMNQHIETQILQGKGKSYGVELLAEKKQGRISGWIGYTWARTFYKIPGINNGKPYSPRYDIRHNLSATGSYEFSKQLTFSSTFKLASGGFITLPEQIFVIDGAAFFHYPSRNNYKLPLYHRLDCSAIYRSKKNEHRKIKSEWVFSVYNLYNRKNIYSLFVRQNPDNFTSASAYKMSLFGITPNIAYSIMF